MKLMAICGNYSKGENAANGQLVKTLILTEALKEQFPDETIKCIDTSRMKKNPFSILVSVIKSLHGYSNVILLPAQLAIKILLPLYVMLNKIYKRKLHYYVVGGWLTEMLESKPKMLKYLKSLTGIYVELHSMEDDLKKLGLNNVFYVNKFRKLNLISQEDLKIVTDKEPHKLCYFARVRKDKGIEEVINAVDKVNSQCGRTVFTLDIFGKVDNDYQPRFDELLEQCSENIRYKGFVYFTDSTDILKQYFALVFPTYYAGEGYANTIVDAYAAGLPVIATNWKYNSEVIRDRIDGILYEWDKPEQLVEILSDVASSPERILSMKKNALERAKEYDPNSAIQALINEIVN